MYTIAFPIHVYRASQHQYYMPSGLARDLLAQLAFEGKLHILCPTAPTLESVTSPFCINTVEHPGLNITLLPYKGTTEFYYKLFSIIRMLRHAAGASSVWHTCCSTKLLDLNTLSFYVGRYFAQKLRVLCLDSDPASMIEKGNAWNGWKARIIRARYRQQAREVDATIFVGAGVENAYGRFARRFVTTAAVWLVEGELADKSETIKKFEERDSEVIRIALPTRLTQWKGTDDAISAFKKLRRALPAWHLDIIGEGPERDRLHAQAAELLENISFVDPLDYGDIFLSRLRSYHIVLIPTRGLEEARIAYDAAASGCIIVHSDTPTLQNALSSVPIRWEFEPGNIDSLSEAILTAIKDKRLWKNAAVQGIKAMKGRTIQEMHKVRHDFLRSLR